LKTDCEGDRLTQQHEADNPLIGLVMVGGELSLDLVVYIERIAYVSDDSRAEFTIF
jgi:hypothetical protein